MHMASAGVLSFREAGWAHPLAAGPEPAALMGGRQAQLVGVS